MQKLSYLSGMCYLSPKTHLCIHPKYGSWIALRAAIVFNCIYDKEPPVLMVPVCPECEIKQGEMLDEILKNKETNIKVFFCIIIIIIIRKLKLLKNGLILDVFVMLEKNINIVIIS